MGYCIWKSYRAGLDPLAIFEVLSRKKNCFFLDASLRRKEASARYSFLGIEPFFILETRGRDPFPQLRSLLDAYKMSFPGSGIPFLGGAVGYLSYDLGLVLEKKVRPLPKEHVDIPESHFGFYNTVIAIDHFKKLFYICASGFPEKKYSLAQALAKRNFKKMAGLFSAINSKNVARYRSAVVHPAQDLDSNFSKGGYFKAIGAAQDYIRAGDIYQVNLAQQFFTKSTLSSPELYCRLRARSPSSFGAFQDCGDFQIISSSPERFLQLAGRRVVTRPMKGTRPRGNNKREDAQLKHELNHSAKDKAELLMITDLERNDLGRVCSYDSIKVTRLRQLETYSTVFQTTATVEGELHKDKDRIDLLRACFPGGSITGCPKIRSMEIIEELEPSRRAIYTGCLGYLSFSGGMDFNILIRTMLKKGERVSFGAGGGIVADSQPEKEYEETLVKAKAMINALGGY
ncbi:MAG: aminodeoxychorismate synthase component I [Candidatus Omnitrophica bacterium]|nr:aminodeoxychorismate synthase component I [Candidatus Omnitrophota bacterium]